MSCAILQADAAVEERADFSFRVHVLKPVLNEPAYLAVLNERLRRHPMYLEGMVFPGGQSTAGAEAAVPLAAMVRDTRWDDFGIFASVIDEVRLDYDLAGVEAAAVEVRAG